MDKSRKVVLVTGAAGYIGSTLLPHLLSKGYLVIAVDNFFHRNHMSVVPLIAHHRLEFINHDVTDYKFMQNLIKSADVVIHLAALVGAPLCDKNPDYSVNVNEVSTYEIASMMRSDQQLIFMNTNSGYGVGEKKKVYTEEDELNPISLYGKTKTSAERAVVSQSSNYTVFRLATLFGSGSRVRRDLLVNNLVWRAMEDRTLIIYQPHNMRNYVHVMDVVRAISQVVEDPKPYKNEIYNLGNDSINRSKAELADTISNFVPCEIYFGEGEDPDKRDYVVTSQKFYEAGEGFKPIFSLEKGIVELKKVYTVIKDCAHEFGNY